MQSAIKFQNTRVNERVSPKKKKEKTEKEEEADEDETG